VVEQENQKVKTLIDSASSGEFNPYEMHRRLGEEMTLSCTVVREEEPMLKTLDSVRQMKQDYKKIKLSDTGMWTNQNLSFTRALEDMLLYAEVILEASIKRKESRGSHYRPDYPDRIDKDFHFTTVAKYIPADDSHTLEYEQVPSPMVEPRARTYAKAEKNEDKKEEVAASK